MSSLSCLLSDVEDLWFQSVLSLMCFEKSISWLMPIKLFNLENTLQILDIFMSLYIFPYMKKILLPKITQSNYFLDKFILLSKFIKSNNGVCCFRNFEWCSGFTQMAPKCSNFRIAIFILIYNEMSWCWLLTVF